MSFWHSRFSRLGKLNIHPKKKVLYNYFDDSNALTLGEKAQAENVFMTGKVTLPRLQPNEWNKITEEMLAFIVFKQFISVEDGWRNKSVTY